MEGHGRKYKKPIPTANKMILYFFATGKINLNNYKKKYTYLKICIFGLITRHLKKPEKK